MQSNAGLMRRAIRWYELFERRDERKPNYYQTVAGQILPFVYRIVPFPVLHLFFSPARCAAMVWTTLFVSIRIHLNFYFEIGGLIGFR